MKKGIALAILMGFWAISFDLGNAAPSLFNPQEAARLKAEKSYQLAAAQYAEVLKDHTFSHVEKREYQFQYADCAWRSQEETLKENAEKILRELAGETTRLEIPQDAIWAQANQSLAELLIQKDRWSFAQEAKERLELARDYWAGSTDLKAARVTFIQTSFLLGDLITQNWGWYYNDLKPIQTFREAAPYQTPDSLKNLYVDILEVAASDEDKAKAVYSLGMCFLNQYGNPAEMKKAEKYFKDLIELYGRSEWVDDAYFNLGQYYERLPDFKKALDVYRDFTGRFRKGESSYFDQIQARIKDIVAPSLQVQVAANFLPDSQIKFSLGWKNLNQVKLTFYSVDLTKELVLNPAKLPADYERGIEYYPQLLKYLVESGRFRSLPVALSFDKTLKNEGTYQWYSEDKGLSEWRSETKEMEVQKGILPVGAYLLVASSGSTQAYELVLVTDMGLVSKIGGRSALFYTFDSLTGQPRAEVAVKFHYRYYDNQGQWVWEEGRGTTDSLGILNLPLKISNRPEYFNQHNVFVTVSDGKMQAFSQSNYYSYYGQQGPWYLYAYSDRPAYRPNEEVSVKGIVRQHNGQTFITPQGTKLMARIYDPRGTQIKETSYTLSPYGSFHDTLKLDEKAPLGEYRMELWNENWSAHIGNAVLFRLEEYKLPEFNVTVKPKPFDDPKRAGSYKLGERIELELDAAYYFGGPVANAQVEFLVYQNPYYSYYYPRRAYEWYYDLLQPQPYYGGGQLITQTTVQTDADGKAVFGFDTPDNFGYDLRYSIEARVVDQSRREIRATADVKVMRTAFQAYLTPQQNLYRPGDQAQVDIKTMDANEQPHSIDGKITITRNWWTEPAPLRERIDKSINTSEMDARRPVAQGHYDETVVLTKFVKTDAKGEAVLQFSPEKDGYYLVKFSAFDHDGEEIQASATVFVCEKQSRDIGYRYGGLQIIAEKDTFAIGDTARVMLVSDKPGSWVLFSSETDEILSYQLIHLDGAVKLLELPVEPSWTPNIFLNALSAADYQLNRQQVELIIPPEENFLNVKITSDKEIYLPGEKGSFDIQVTDIKGEPVGAEIALGLTDASVYYIQEEFVPDIRQFFYGTKRNLSVATQSSFNFRPYTKWIRDEEKGLIADDKNFRFKDQNASKGAAAIGDEMKGEGGERKVLGSALANSTELDQVKTKQENRRGDAPRELERLEKNNGLLRSPAAEKIFEEQIPGQLAQPKVRSDFRSTVIWQPAILTDKEGKAQVTVTFPDSLTTWRTTAKAITTETKIGNITHEVKTTKTILVRLQAPRFLTERDQSIISANVHNYSDQEQKIKVTLESKGLKVLSESFVWVTVKPQEEKRVDWKTLAEQAGSAEVLVKVQTEKESDAVLRTYPVIPHGIEKFLTGSLVFKGGTDSQTQSFSLNLPKERIPGSTRLRLVSSPSLAAAMLDALPYLADYPYGCIEQTMSRFLPAVIAAKTLKDLGFSQKDVDDYIEHVLKPSGDPAGHPDRRSDPTLSQLHKMTREGLERLYDAQHPDGGWGWFKEGESDHFMSAYVVWGLSLAKEAGIAIRDNVLSPGINFLQLELVEEEKNPDTLAWMLHALATAKSTSKFENTQREHLWELRDQLNPYSRALFALSEFYRGNKERAQTLSRNLMNGMKEDQDNQTVHWGESGIHYRFSEGGVEATAFVVKALANIDPASPYLEPAVRWLSLNRRGARWKNTRDTAIVILSLADYLKKTDQLTPDYEMEVWINGRSVQKEHVTQKNIFTFDRYIDVSNEALQDGANEIKVVFKGQGALYLSGYLEFFTLEENITKASSEAAVQRQYFLEDKKETLLKGFISNWKPLKEGTIIRSGQRIRAELLIEAKNNYEYLIVEDLKPAGMEAVELKSGAGSAAKLNFAGKEEPETTWIYQEFRDQKAAFFIPNLKQGKYLIRYELRAEVPGEFHGMPSQMHAMYVPELRANGDENRVVISD